jgi:hypothetical protein
MVQYYFSCRNQETVELIPFFSSSPIAEIIAVAYQCASAVYDTKPNVADNDKSDEASTPNIGAHRKPTTRGISFEELEYVKPSLVRTSKAMGFWIVSNEESTVKNDNLPALVIAIRGTSGYLDHMVNVNGRPSSVSEFLV